MHTPSNEGNALNLMHKPKSINMKHLLLFLFLLVSSFGFSQITRTYNANGNSGFGGAVGGGSLAITDSDDSLSFSFNRGPGLFDSVLVFYIDGESGGISSTSNLPGSANPYQAAVAGLNTVMGQRAVLNFPTEFEPEMAVAFDNVGGQIFFFADLGSGVVMQEGATFTITPSGTNNAPTYTHTAAKSSLGYVGATNFKFVGTYIGHYASRSNEAFGDPFTNYMRLGRTSIYAPYTITNFFTFSSTLPVKLTGFNAAKEGNAVNINWSVAEESNISSYEVQRSGNGINFQTIGTVAARNEPGARTYRLKDNAPLAAGSYYRLAIVENGKKEYSKIFYINNSGGKSSFVASSQYKGNLTLTMNGIQAGTYQLSLINGTGQVMQSMSLQHDGNNGSKQIQLSTLQTGIYRVVLQSSKEKYVASILIR